MNFGKSHVNQMQTLFGMKRRPVFRPLEPRAPDFRRRPRPRVSPPLPPLLSPTGPPLPRGGGPRRGLAPPPLERPLHRLHRAVLLPPHQGLPLPGPARLHRRLPPRLLPRCGPPSQAPPPPYDNVSSNYLVQIFTAALHSMNGAAVAKAQIRSWTLVAQGAWSPVPSFPGPAWSK